MKLCGFEIGIDRPLFLIAGRARAEEAAGGDRARAKRPADGGEAMKLCGFEIGIDRPLFLIAGPCVVESLQLQIDVAGELRDITSDLRIPFIFKSSYDKANRSSGASFRGPGMEEGPARACEVRRQLGVPVLTDVHTEGEVQAAAAVVDVLQTPAFLCRQTDYIQAVARAGLPVNIKKGQFLAPDDMLQVVARPRSAAVPTTSWVRAGHHVRLSQPRVRTCARSPSCARRAARWSSTPRIRCSCPAAWDVQRRPAGVRAGACAARGRGRRGGPVHGNASRSGARAVGRAECLAARPHARAAAAVAGIDAAVKRRGSSKSDLATEGAG